MSIKDIVMRIKDLYEAKIPGPKWRRWTEQEIKEEYSFKTAKPAYIKMFQEKGTGVFNSYTNFKDAVEHATVAELTPEFERKINRLVITHSFDELDELVSGYIHKRDWKRIKQGYEHGAQIPMPIILKIGGSYTIIGGNTRINVYRILKLPGNPKVLVLDGNEYPPRS
jgi:hypothetical protein